MRNAEGRTLAHLARARNSTGTREFAYVLVRVRVRVLVLAASADVRRLTWSRYAHAA